MNAEARRDKILKILENGKTVTANKLAERFGVTRQIIVSDIALLRSSGNAIFAGKNGYSLEGANGVSEVFVCRHSAGQLQQELYAVVDNGGTLVDETVEHPAYGEIRAAMNISSRHDADVFLQTLRDSRSEPLCSVSGGLHSHTVSAPDSETLERIRERLNALGLLAGDNAASRATPAWLF